MLILSCIGFFLEKKKAFALVHPFWEKLFHLLLVFLRVKADFSGLKPQGRYLFYSNHQSFLDIILVGAYLPIPVLMKEELSRIPFFGFMTKVAGSIPVSRYNIASREGAKEGVMKTLREGFSVHFYPEGTRKQGDQPTSISFVKRSLFDLVYRENIGVVPVTLKGTNKMKLAWRNDPINVKIHFGEVIDPKDYANEDLFFEQAWSRLISDFNAL